MQWWVGRGIYTEEKPGVRCLGTGVTEDSLGLQEDRVPHRIHNYIPICKYQPVVYKLFEKDLYIYIYITLVGF